MVIMNDTELERLIDNNLSNAIKHSNDKSEIKVILEKNNAEIILKFISQGQKIYDASKIFHKGYTETYGAKRSLGLGLNMVRIICEKNNIIYSANSEEGINTFTYIFKV
jgi:K+-sensing histidine kinase KdpD